MKLVEEEDYLIYIKDNTVVGKIDYHFEEDNSVYIDFFQIFDGFRAFGLGLSMLKDMIDFFIKSDIRFIRLEAIPFQSSMSMSKLIDFYLKGGFDFSIRGTNYLEKDLKVISYKFK